MEKIACEIIEDLLPSYLDEVLSDSVKEAVEIHLKSCSRCSERLEELRQQIGKEEQEQQKKGKQFLKKIKRRKYYLIGMLIGAAIPIGAFIIFVIDILILSY